MTDIDVDYEMCYLSNSQYAMKIHFIQLASKQE